MLHKAHLRRTIRVDEILIPLMVALVLIAYLAFLWFTPQWYWRACLVGFVFLGLSLLGWVAKLVVLRNADGILTAFVIGFAVDGLLLCLPYYLIH